MRRFAFWRVAACFGGLALAGVLHAQQSELDSASAAEQFIFTAFAEADKSTGGPLGGLDIYSTENVDGVEHLYAGMDREFLDKEFNTDTLDAIMQAMDELRFREGSAPRFRMLVRYADDANSPFRVLTDYLPAPPPSISKPEGKSAPVAKGQNPQQGQGQPAGYLSGKSIFLSGGHGWYYSTTSSSWVTQRGVNATTKIIEDHSNAEFVDNYVSRYLYNAGAGVYTVRERDMNTNMVIVDNGGSGYSETGSWTASTSGYNGSMRVAATTTGTATATATFTPAIPAAGYYEVYVWYQPSGTTTSAAQYTVNHAGGSTLVTQNMNRDGYSWKNIGRYYFEAGASAATGSVVLTNKSTSSGNVVADAVRFGGGVGQVVDPDSGGTSGKPQFEESGFYYAGFMGKSDWASYGTVSAMPSYAAWENETWEDSVFVSMHTNAGGSRGSLGITYGTCWDCWSDTTYAGPTGSRELRESIMTEMLSAIRTNWDSSWPKISSISRAYGEVNTSYNNEMPSTLIEVGFHDSAVDGPYMVNPEFRRDVARGIYKGIVKYYAARDGQTARFLPEPPTHLRVKNNGNGTITIGWNAPPSGGVMGDAATGYRVYTSTHPKGFADGMATTSTSYTINTGLTPGEMYYVRVSATNLGGESFPTETLAVRYQAAETSKILIVNGFDRLDAGMNIVQASAYRNFLDRMNSYDYATIAAKDIKAYGQYCDSTSNEAIESGAVALGNYPAVVWLLGEESTKDKTFSPAEQSAVTAYLNGGGQLFVSGSEIGYELDGSSVAPTFYNNLLKADYVRDSAGTYSVNSTGGIFSGLGTFTFDNGSNTYNVDSADAMSPLGGATAVLTYNGGAGGTAGIQYDGTYRLVMFGFPYETIVDPNMRLGVMAKVLDFFDLTGGVVIVPDLVIESRDSAGNLTANPPYSESGEWLNSTAKSLAAGLSGSGSRFSDSATPGNDTVTVVPNITDSGVYEVAVTWNTSSNASNVRYLVKSLDGDSEFFLDQKPSGTAGGGNYDEWIVLGQFPFAAGQNAASGSLLVDESTVTGPASTYNTGRVYADGFRWRFIESIDVTPTPTATPSPTETPTPTPSPTLSPTPSATPSPTETPTPSPTPEYDGWPFGDFDNSHCTDLNDFLYMLDNWQQTPGGRPMGLDQFLNLLDYWHQGSTC